MRDVTLRILRYINKAHALAEKHTKMAEKLQSVLALNVRYLKEVRC